MTQKFIVLSNGPINQNFVENTGIFDFEVFENDK